MDFLDTYMVLFSSQSVSGTSLQRELLRVLSMADALEKKVRIYSFFDREDLSPTVVICFQSLFEC